MRKNNPFIYRLNDDYIAVSVEAFKFIQAQLFLLEKLKNVPFSSGVNPPAPEPDILKKDYEVTSV